MDFDEMVGHFKELREHHQQLPFPAPFPPHLICFDGETIVCRAASPRQTAHHIATLFSAAAVSKADRAVFGMDTLVRDMNKGNPEQPLGADPDARKALLVIDAERPVGNVNVALEAYAVDDGGALNWIWGAWYSPLANQLIGALHEVLGTDVPNSVLEYVLWMQVNGYAIQAHPSLLDPGE